MLPSDEVEQPPTMADKNCFVADGAEITRAVAVKKLIDLVGPGRADKPGDGGVRVLFVPVIHRRDESCFGFVRGRNDAFIYRRPSPAAVVLLHRLRFLELIELPEYRQPAIGFR